MNPQLKATTDLARTELNAFRTPEVMEALRNYNKRYTFIMKVSETSGWNPERQKELDDLKAEFAFVLNEDARLLSAYLAAQKAQELDKRYNGPAEWKGINSWLAEVDPDALDTDEFYKKKAEGSQNYSMNGDND
jgi:hypothetical protein